MDISLSNQLLGFVYSLVIGIFLGTIYDVFRIVRIFLGMGYRDKSAGKYDDIRLPFIGSRNERNIRRKKNENGQSEPSGKKFIKFSELFKDIAVFFQDILYFLIAAPIFIIFIYHANNGEIRWFLGLGAFAGFMLYYFTIGHLVMLVSELIIFIIRTIFSYILFITVKPAVFVVNWICRKTKLICSFVYCKISKKINLKKMKKYTAECKSRLPQLVRVCDGYMETIGDEINEKDEKNKF